MDDVTDREPVGAPESFVGYSLVQAGHALERRFEAALAPTGLTAREFGVLAHLARDPGMGSGQLARLVLVTPQSMGDLVAALVAAGCVERAADPGRGRRVALRLTDTGRDALTAASPIVAAFERDTIAGLTDEEAATLNRLLRRVLIPPD